MKWSLVLRTAERRSTTYEKTKPSADPISPHKLGSDQPRPVVPKYAADNVPTPPMMAAIASRGLASLTFPSEVKRAERVTLLEEHDESVLAEATEPIVAGDTIRISVRPFEVMTLRVVL